MILTNLVNGVELEITDDGVSCVQRAPTVTVVYFQGMLVSAADTGPYFRAIEAAPDVADRHDDLADGMRAEAGRIAMEIEDTMVRARLIDHLDGWGGVCGKLIERTDEGELYHSSDEDVEVKMLKVVCPSTSRVYVLLVPEEMTTVQEARLFINRGVAPSVET